MTVVYLIVNSVLYFIFAGLCLAKVDATSKGLGYAALTAGGQSEYAVVYGGLQLGLAIFFAWSVWAGNNSQRVALVAAVCLYAPIVVIRIASIFVLNVRAPVTLGTAALEMVLLAWGVFCLYGGRVV